MKFETEYKIPTYPSRWRRWLWYATRGRFAFPVWEVWDLGGCEQTGTTTHEDGTVSVDFTFTSAKKREQ